MKKKLFIFLFFLWIAIAIFNVCFNSVKIVSELRQWTYLTDQEKRYKIFGDLYSFCVFINNYTPDNSQILLFSQDNMFFYYERYCLFPRIITNVSDKNNFQNLVSTNKFTYIVPNDSVDLKNYKKIANFSKKLPGGGSVLYQRK